MHEGQSIFSYQLCKARGMSEEAIEKYAAHHMELSRKNAANPTRTGGIDILDVLFGLFWVAVIIGWCAAWAS